MYSPDVQALLRAAGLSIGDRLRYSAPGKAAEGMLLPHADLGDPSCLVVKLDSGYNIGLQAKGAKLGKIPSSGAGSSPFAKAKTHPHPAAAEPSSPPHRPPVALISTGGTIAAKVDYRTGAVHPALSARELLATYPRLASFAPLAAHSLFNILSEDMRPEFWTRMAQGVSDAFSDGAEGVVITHGTDTMGYSAAALSYALDELPGPVVLTGAQRSPDRGSSDAAQNLFCAAAAARADFAAVAVCMHASSSDDFNLLHAGTRVRKSHTSGRWAFRSVGIPPMGKVMAESGQVLMQEGLAPKRPPASSAPRPKRHDQFSDNVHLAWVYPGLNAKTVSSWGKYDGVVLAATGLGHAPIDALHPDSRHSVLPAIRELTAGGVVVAAAPQTLEGRINLDVYSAGRLLAEAGVVGHGCDWPLETAYVKLCWALGQHKDAKKAVELLLRPKANDITARSNVTSGEEERP